MAKKQTTESLHKQIEACKARISNERDKLRELIDDAAAVEGSCDDAIEALESAADSLSQYL